MLLFSRQTGIYIEDYEQLHHEQRLAKYAVHISENIQLLVGNHYGATTMSEVFQACDELIIMDSNLNIIMYIIQYINHM